MSLTPLRLKLAANSLMTIVARIGYTMGRNWWFLGKISLFLLAIQSIGYNYKH